MSVLLADCMAFLRVLAGLRTPFFDVFFSTITHLGEETLFTAAALLFFWCIDKRKGYFVLYIGLLGTIVNQWLKILFCIPRPWILDPDFPIVESARAQATGFSFPSGHTQSISGIGFSITRMYKRPAVRIAAIAAVALVAFSRMYLGVHTPLDVGFSLLFAFVLALALYAPFRSEAAQKSAMPWLLGALAAVALAFLLFMRYGRMPAEAAAENVAEGAKNAHVLFGTVLGFAAVYFFEERFVRFDVRAPWWAQILKLVFGLGLVVGVKALLKQPLLDLFGGSGFSHTVRYFCTIFLAGGLYPMLFRFFKKPAAKDAASGSPEPADAPEA